jgi:hypothetical protein
MKYYVSTTVIHQAQARKRRGRMAPARRYGTLEFVRFADDRRSLVVTTRQFICSLKMEAH